MAEEVAEEIETEETSEEIEDVSTEETGEEASPDTEEEVIISIGDEDSPPHDEKEDSSTIKGMRKQIQESNSKLRESEEKLKKYTGTAETVELGPKPTLESSNHDAAVFERDLEAYHKRKRAVDDRKLKQDEQVKASEEKWQATLQNHNQKKKELKVKDIEEVEATVEASLDETQLGIIKHAAENSARVVVALGTHPEKLKELADIKDPVKFSFAVAKMETQLKTTTRRPATSPETTVSGTAQLSSGGTDKHLEKLEKESEKSGDRTKVNIYKRNLKNKKKE